MITQHRNLILAFLSSTDAHGDDIDICRRLRYSLCIYTESYSIDIYMVDLNNGCSSRHSSRRTSYQTR